MVYSLPGPSSLSSTVVTKPLATSQQPLSPGFIMPRMPFPSAVSVPGLANAALSALSAFDRPFGAEIGSSSSSGGSGGGGGGGGSSSGSTGIALSQALAAAAENAGIGGLRHEGIGGGEQKKRARK
jgi:hypothetical protein